MTNSSEIGVSVGVLKEKNLVYTQRILLMKCKFVYNNKEDYKKMDLNQTL